MLYQIKCDDAAVKQTYGWTHEVAELAALDYQQRFGSGRVEPLKKDAADFHFDAGGMMPIGMPTVKIQAGELCATIYADQVEIWDQAFRKILSPTYDRGGWVKIHAKWNCLCVPLDVLSLLSSKTSEVVVEANRQADLAFAAWEARHPHPK